MNRRRANAPWLLFANLLIAVPIAAQNGIENKIKTNKNVYMVGETIKITCSWSNGTHKTLVYKGSYGDEFGCMQSLRIRDPKRDLLPLTSGPLSILALKVDRQTNDIPQFKLLPGKIKQATASIPALGGDYDLTMPGTYFLAFGDSNAVSIKLIPGDIAHTELNRRLARTGDPDAISYLGANRDSKSVALLSASYTSRDYLRKSLIAEALAHIGTDQAVDTLGSLLRNSAPADKKELKACLAKSRNPRAEKILSDYEGQAPR